MWRPNSSCRCEHANVQKCRFSNSSLSQSAWKVLMLAPGVKWKFSIWKCEICTGKGWLDNWGQLISRAANHCVFWFHTHTNATAVGAFQHWCCKVYMGHNSWLKTPSQCVQCCSQQGNVYNAAPSRAKSIEPRPTNFPFILLFFSSVPYADKKTSLIFSTVVHMERILGQHCCFCVFLCFCVRVKALGWVQATKYGHSLHPTGKRRSTKSDQRKAPRIMWMRGKKKRKIN